MIEAYNDDGLAVLINPAKVVEVYRGSVFCNVKMENGTLHRFTHSQAQKVYEALRDWPPGGPEEREG